MKIRWAFLRRRSLKEESGQVFVVSALGSILLVGLAGIAIEVGHGYYALELLQASTDEATLAAATGLPNATLAQTNANNYSSIANENNAIGILNNATVTATPFCSTSVTTAYGVACQSATPGGTAYNAVRVVQTATSPLWIGKMFGVPLFNLTAVGTAAMDVDTCKLCNIAVIIDTTGTMNDTDTSGDCGSGSYTSETCALQGFQALLKLSYPCYAGQTCTSASANPDDVVSLFVFPMVTGATASDDTNCGSTGPATVAYTLPTHTAETFGSNGVANGGEGYQILNFSAGATYRTSDTSSGSTWLNSGDLLVNAAGWGCPGLNITGGKGTYLAQVIYEAGEALQVEQAARPGSANFMIILSDGNMDATGNYTWTNSSNCTGTITGLAPTSAAPSQTCKNNGTEGESEMQPTNGVLTPTTTAPNNLYSQINGTKVPAWSAQQNIYTYPSLVGQCGQSVQAAKDVATQQTVTYTTLDGTSTTYTLNNSDDTKYTKVYTIAYVSPNASTGAGSQTGGDPQNTTSSQACFSDLPYDVNHNWWTACTATTCTQTVTTGGGSWPTPTSGEGSIVAFSPCASMAAMASSPANFFSDNAGSPACPATDITNQNITSMTGIFTSIFESLGSPKLIPNGTT